MGTAFGGFLLLLFLTIGPIGFNPTDEGLITAQSYRLLHGDVPHLDIASPRPLGSAILHTVDFAVPLPLLDAWRLVALAEVMAYTVLFGVLVFGKTPRRWNVLQVTGVMLATLLNINTFPLTSWHTTDGLLLVAAGFVLVVRGTAAGQPLRWRTGMLLLGCAVLMKQSFAPAVVVGLIVLAARCPRRRHGRGVEVALGALLAAAPVAAYVGAIAALGGLAPLVDQLTGATRVPYGGDLGDAVQPSTVAGTRMLAAVTLSLATSMVLWWPHEWLRIPGRKRPTSVNNVRLVAGVALVALVAWVVLGQAGRDWQGRSLLLWVGGAWSTGLFWIALGMVAGRLVVRHHVDVAGTLIVSAGWMASLSWGVPKPNAVAGSFVLLVVCRAWRRAVGPRYARRRVPPFVSAVAVVLLVVPSLAVWQQRHELVDRDRRSEEQTFPLRRVAADFGRARTNANTGRYLLAAVDCIRSHPATSVAVLPDNAGLYPVLGLRNPLPTDWFFPPEYRGAEPQVREAVQRMAEQGDYLVLFQRLPADLLAAPDFDVRLHATGGPYRYPDDTLTPTIADGLPGARVDCGPFIAIYRPANQRS